MKQHTFLAFAAGLIALSLTCVVGGSSVTPVRAAGETAQATFSAKCAFCHGEKGRPTDMGKAMQAKDLTSNEVQSETDETLRRVITAGKGNMPPFGSTLSAYTTNQLVRYVRSFKNQTPSGARVMHK